MHLIKFFVRLTVSAEFLNGIGSRYFFVLVTIFNTEGKNKTSALFGTGRGVSEKQKTIWGIELLQKQFLQMWSAREREELWEEGCQLC